MKRSEHEEAIHVYDTHVHLMSPYLVSYWKNIGIPFSKSEASYSTIDTILKNNGAQRIDLIGMGYVYGNPEYYQGEDAYEKLREENNYLLEEAKKYPDRVRPFFTVDPLKEYALEEWERCSALAPGSGLKLHFNTSQVYLTEPEHLKKVKPIFAAAANSKMPILLHFDNWHPKFGKRDLEIFVDSILTDIPPVDLRIAHFGTSGGFNERTKHFLDAYLELRKADRIPARHRVRFDISAVALDKDSEGVAKLTAEEFGEVRAYIDKIGVENIVFGTDYPLISSEEYIKVLKDKLNFTQEELAEINRE